MEYTIRESARARKVRLIVSARDGLVVVIPRGVAGPRLTREDIDRIVAAHRDWIERTRRKVLQRQEARRAAAQAPPPSVLDLPAIGERWQIRYRATGHPGVRLTEQTRARRLEVEGAVHDSRACRAVLKGWLRQKARMHLIPWLERVSAETGLRYQQARVRCQKTRWGSCSNRGTINLNVKALFLPPELVRHLLVHELCHTVHLNHSPAFWALVRRHDPDAERLRRRLRTANRLVPPWFEADG